MSLLLSEEILPAICRELDKSRNSVQVVTAFCKLPAIEKLSKHISSTVSEKRILIRFLLSDLIGGSTDFMVLDYCMRNGWNCFIRFDLHAKTYIFDNSRLIVSSANATKSGLGLSANGNMEVATLVLIEKEDMSKINSLFENSIRVTEKIFKNLKIQYENVIRNKAHKNSATWDDSIMKLYRPKITALFSYELPNTHKPICSEKEKNVLKENFRVSNAYLWLVNVLVENNDCMYFGELTEALHSTIVSDPKPYRKDVKEMLSNLLSWIEILNMEDVAIDIPRHSQRVRLVNHAKIWENPSALQ